MRKRLHPLISPSMLRCCFHYALILSYYLASLVVGGCFVMSCCMYISRRVHDIPRKRLRKVSKIWISNFVFARWHGSSWKKGDLAQQLLLNSIAGIHHRNQTSCFLCLALYVFEHTAGRYIHSRLGSFGRPSSGEPDLAYPSKPDSCLWGVCDNFKSIGKCQPERRHIFCEVLFEVLG